MKFQVGPWESFGGEILKLIEEHISDGKFKEPVKTIMTGTLPLEVCRAESKPGLGRPWPGWRTKCRKRTKYRIPKYRTDKMPKYRTYKMPKGQNTEFHNTE